MSRELDAKVAEKVMGWMVNPTHDQFKPSTDPAADYSVLVKVREAWGADATGKFVDALVELWHFPTPLMYRPGDYAKAALTALGVEHTEGSPR